MTNLPVLGSAFVATFHREMYNDVNSCFEKTVMNKIVFTDQLTTISELKRKVQEFIDERDWTNYHTPRNLAESISIESAELLEIFQWLTEQETKNLPGDKAKLDRIKEELADVMVYCISLANSTGIDISEAISSKIEKNVSKYPIEKVKGNYKKYTDLK